jgi:hypothetical protein
MEINGGGYPDFKIGGEGRSGGQMSWNMSSRGRAAREATQGARGQ